MDITHLHVGDEVHYQPAHFEDEEWENGLVKEIRENVTDSVWVVYNCGGKWHRYNEYTSAKTNLRDLRIGWRYKGGE